MNMLDPSRLGRFSVGFDRLWDELDALTNRNAPTYPPYNILQVDDNTFRISLAVAGFERSELVITNQNNELVVSGKKVETEDESAKYIHKGIAARNFQLSWKLADHVEVVKANMENGLLHIDLNRKVPKEMLPRQIDIQ